MGLRGRALGVLSASALAVGGMVAMAGPASAATQTIACGQSISGIVTAANNIGPCTGGDAIRITTSGTVLDLGGHSIKCNNANNHTRVEQVGIHLIGASNVTVRNGEVSNCDAGVSIDGGGRNTISNIRAHDNIAHVLVAGPVDVTNPLTTPCNIGDGITTDNSSGNTIKGNVVTHNGPYSGISLVDASNNNKVTGNQANNQNVSNELPFGLRNPPFDTVTITNKALTANVATLTANVATLTPPAVPYRVGQTVIVSGVGAPFDGTFTITAVTGTTFSYNVTGPNVVSAPATGSASAQGDTNGPCGPFSATPQGEGRLHQDIGIRVEGPGALNNTVTGNQAAGNQLNGISIHGYVCFNGLGPVLPPDLPPRGTDNTGNQIIGNSVSGNGFPDGLDGIGILSQGPLGTVTCGSSHNTIKGNTSTGNAGSGIFVARTGDNAKTSSNIIVGNRVDGNTRDGITLQGPNTVCPFSSQDPDTGRCIGPREPRNGANFNTLTINNGHGNTRRDGFDGNPGCDDNHWTGNIFGTVNQACVSAGGGTGTVIPVP